MGEQSKNKTGVEVQGNKGASPLFRWYTHSPDYILRRWAYGAGALFTIFAWVAIFKFASWVVDLIQGWLS